MQKFVPLTLLSGVLVDVFQSRAGVVEDDAIGRFQETFFNERAGGGDAGRTLGGREDSLEGSELPGAVENLLVADCDGGSGARTEDIQDQHVAERLGDAQPSGE